MGYIDAYERKCQIIQKLDLTSDIFCGKVLEDKDACEEVLGIILGEEITLKSVHSQYVIRNLVSHSVILDIFAESVNKKKFHFEIQNQDNDNHVKRNRYNRSCIDVSLLDKGVSYEDLPELFQIFLTKSDFFNGKKPIYFVQRIVGKDEKINAVFNDETHEVYVNLTILSEINESLRQLQEYFLHTDSEHEGDMISNLVKRVNFLRRERKGNDIMCEELNEMLDEYLQRGIDEGRKMGIVELLEDIGKIPRKFKAKMKTENRSEVLSNWHRLAAKSTDMDDFLEKALQNG